MKKWLTFATSIVCIALLAQSCKKEEEEIDATLWNEINGSGYAYYTGTPGITAAVGNSPHGFERVRFNTIAQQALDIDGKLPAGSAFPDGAVIVKEIFTSATGPLELYAIMKKNSTSLLAGGGYEWAEFTTDGNAAFSSDKKGNGCISCHSGNPNRDLVLTFDLH